MNLQAAALSALLLLAGTSLSEAGPVVDAAQRAEELQAEGKIVEALDALDAAVEAIWQSAPLAFRNVTLVDEAAPAGQAAERTDRTYRPDEKLVVHVEPVGYGYGQSGGRATIAFAGDLAIENATGQVLTEAKDLFSVSVETSPGRREFDMNLAFQVPYVRPGDYIARFTLRDRNSTKSGSFDVPFTVTAPAAADAGETGSATAPGASPQ